jgi:hypothetical protein
MNWVHLSCCYDITLVHQKAPPRLDYEHMIKARAHKEGVRIGKAPKKLASICCRQRRETKADTLKQLRPIGKGEQVLEKRLDQKELT